jgi:hypothetical protein
MLVFHSPDEAVFLAGEGSQRFGSLLGVQNEGSLLCNLSEGGAPRLLLSHGLGE